MSALGCHHCGCTSSAPCWSCAIGWSCVGPCSRCAPGTDGDTGTPSESGDCDGGLPPDDDTDEFPRVLIQPDGSARVEGFVPAHDFTTDLDIPF
ncbi:MAG: hypothetical protein ACI8RZ_006462 [Myxococcota bacterium]